MLLMSTIGCMLLARMRPRKPYHHGHLEETLLKTAIQLIGEVGPAGFTLREVARRAGVSHNAPYRHFADREKLLAAGGASGSTEGCRTRLHRVRSPSAGAFCGDVRCAGCEAHEFGPGRSRRRGLRNVVGLGQGMSGQETTTLWRHSSVRAACVDYGPRNCQVGHSQTSPV
jgi:Bacterial regulatory proteins, tetR family